MPRSAIGWTLLALGVVLALRAQPAHADDRPAEPLGVYAGKDAWWWVGELRGAGTARAAYEALKVIGAPAIPALASVLTHRDPALRGAAIHLLREIPGDLRPARDAIGAALDGAESPDVERHLLELTGRLGPDGAALASRVLARLASSSRTLREAALAALERTGGPAELLVPPLRALLTAPEDGTVVMALRALQRLGPQAAPAVPDVVALFAVAAHGAARRSRGREAEAQAIVLLQGIGAVGPEGRACLGEVVSSNRGGLGVAAATALAVIASQEPEAAEELAALAGAELSAARQAAFQALITLRPLPVSVQKRMLHLVRDPDSTLAREALSFLEHAELDVAALVPVLVPALPQRLQDQRLQQVLRQLANRSPEDFVRAIPRDLAVPPMLLVEGLRALVPRLARSAAREEALDLLCGWLERALGPHPTAAGTVEPLVALAGDGAQVTQRLLPLLGGPDEDRAALAAWVLARVPAAAPALIASLASPEVPRRRGALRVYALAHRALSPDEDAAVERAIDDGDETVRRDAVAVLLSSLNHRPARPSTRSVRVQAALVAAVLTDLRSSDAARRRHAIEQATALDIPSGEVALALLPLLDEAGTAFEALMVAGTLARMAAAEPAPVRERLTFTVRFGTPTARASALLALTALRTDEALVLEELTRTLRETSPLALVRALQCFIWLGRQGAPLEPAVRELLTSPDAEVATTAVQVLPLIAPGSEKARLALVRLARDRTHPARLAAVGMLGAYGGASTPDLIALLEDPGARGQALAVLQHLGKDAHDALPALEEELRRTPRDRALRIAVDTLRQQR